MVNVFISYQEHDRIPAERLSMELRDRGYGVVADHLNVMVGDSIVRQIGHEPSDASFLVLFLPEATSTSTWMDREWMSALARQLERANVRVLPVILSGATPPPILADTKYVDLGYDWDGGLNALIKAIDPQAFAPGNPGAAPGTRDQRLPSSGASKRVGGEEDDANHRGAGVARFADSSDQSLLVSSHPSSSEEAHGSGVNSPMARIVEAMPVTIYLSDQAFHQQVETAVEALLDAAGLQIESRDDPVMGSWYRRMLAAVKDVVHSPAAREATLVAAHVADTHLVLAQERGRNCDADAESWTCHRGVAADQGCSDPSGCAASREG